MKENNPKPELAIASGNKNNCGFHCIMHSWLALSDQDSQTLFKNRSVFSKIMERFYERYNINGIPDFNEFMNIVKSYNPRDREILLGPVLREILREDLGLDPKKKKELEKDQEAYDDSLAILANAMGANINFYTDQPWVPIEQGNRFSKEESTWEIALRHRGNHYNFFFSNPNKTESHNKQMQLSPTLTNEKALSTVRTRAHDIRKKASLAKSELTAKTKTEKAESKEREEAFIKQLKGAFPEQEWGHGYHSMATITTINLVHNTDSERRLKIDKLPDGIKCEAPSGKIDDLVAIGKAYNDAFNDNNEDVEYEIAVRSEEEARDFLKQLKASGIELKAVSTIQIADKVLKGDDAADWIEANTPASTPRPRPR